MAKIITQAGLDISTGHALQSLFGTYTKTDPWANQCFMTFVDTLINHDQVLFSLPKAGKRSKDYVQIPYIFRRATEKGLLVHAPKNKAADTVTLKDADIETEYTNFQSWLLTNKQTPNLKSWLEFCKNDLGLHTGIIKDNQTPLFDKVRNEFWYGRRPAGWLQKLPSKYGISDDDLIFAFDVFLRAVQYHRLYGKDTIYFPHPLRTAAAIQVESTTNDEYVSQWSWGSYLLQEYTKRVMSKKDQDKLIDDIIKIKELTQDRKATWYELQKSPDEEKIKIIEGIAVKAGFRGLNNVISKVISGVVDAASVIGIGALSIGLPDLQSPAVGIIVGFGMIPVVDKVKGKADTIAKKLAVRRGWLHFPGLLSSDLERIKAKRHK